MQHNNISTTPTTPCTIPYPQHQDINSTPTIPQPEKQNTTAQQHLMSHTTTTTTLRQHNLVPSAVSPAYTTHNSTVIPPTMDSLLSQQVNSPDELRNSSHKQEPSTEPQEPVSPSKPLQPQSSTQELQPQSLSEELQASSAEIQPQSSSEVLQSSSQETQPQSSSEKLQPLTQEPQASHHLHGPSSLENQGFLTNTKSAYQYPPIWVPKFSDPESGSCDELHQFSSLPQEDDELLTLDGDDLFTQDEEYLVYREKEDLQPPSKRQRLSQPGEKNLSSGKQPSVLPSNSKQPSDSEHPPLVLPQEIVDHLPVTIWGRCDRFKMLGCRRHARLGLAVKRTIMMCPTCDLPLCIYCYLPHHIELLIGHST
ncbi:hypothetical protein Pcinc_027017 [Petrolisthes cinctipes]|uniref:Uncharacterized protein n=1 Tax=Petrolisthes cinctipes TaxID=88211 RepID=A0AAE1KAV2_PETCI|nr:hypothetical protein Pcinc_027017 [Petrolisthes cinctipes]